MVQPLDVQEPQFILPPYVWDYCQQNGITLQEFVDSACQVATRGKPLDEVEVDDEPHGPLTELPAEGLYCLYRCFLAQILNRPVMIHPPQVNDGNGGHWTASPTHKKDQVVLIHSRYGGQQDQFRFAVQDLYQGFAVCEDAAECKPWTRESLMEAADQDA